MEPGFYFLSLRNRLRRSPPDPPARQSVSFDKARRIGLLAASDSDATWQLLGDIRRQLLKLDKEVTTLAYLIETPNDPTLYQTQFFTKKDISLLGDIKSDDVLGFIATPFDYLYCLTTEASPLYESIMCRSRAHCRVGRFSPAMEGCFELMVDLREGETISALWQKMLGLTQAIQNHDA